MPEKVVNELNFRSYCSQRITHPEISPERWIAVFGDAVPEMERRYQEGLDSFAVKLFTEMSKEGFDA